MEKYEIIAKRPKSNLFSADTLRFGTSWSVLLNIDSKKCIRTCFVPVQLLAFYLIFLCEILKILFLLSFFT